MAKARHRARPPRGIKLTENYTLLLLVHCALCFHSHGALMKVPLLSRGPACSFLQALKSNHLCWSKDVLLLGPIGEFSTQNIIP